MTSQQIDTTEWQSVLPYIQQYSLDIVRVVPLAPGRFQLQGRTEWYEARCVSQSSASFRMSVADYAATRGFRRTQRFLLNIYHERVIPITAKKHLYVTHAFQADPFGTTEEECLVVASNLAQLHAALEGGIEVLPPALLRALSSQLRYGSWIQTMQQARFGLEHELKAWNLSSNMNKQAEGQAASSRVHRDWLRQFIEQSLHVENCLISANYKERWTLAKARQTIAWNAYRMSTVRPLASGTIATLQPGDPVLDDELYDLATLCQDICRYGDVTKVKSVLDGYQHIRPLSQAALQAVVAYAAFPQVALAAVRRTHPVDAWLVLAARQYETSNQLLSWFH